MSPYILKIDVSLTDPAQELRQAKLRLEAAARGEENKKKQKAEIEAYEAQQRTFEQERAATEEEVSASSPCLESSGDRAK